jgi:hypothetical protein
MAKWIGRSCLIALMKSPSRSLFSTEQYALVGIDGACSSPYCTRVFVLRPMQSADLRSLPPKITKLIGSTLTNAQKRLDHGSGGSHRKSRGRRRAAKSRLETRSTALAGILMELRKRIRPRGGGHLNTSIAEFSEVSVSATVEAGQNRET